MCIPVPIEQVSVPVGDKAYLPCDTGPSNQQSTEYSSGFFIVMWFKERSENNPENPNDSTSTGQSLNPGEPIYT